MNYTNIAFAIGSLFRRVQSKMLYRACLWLILLTTVARIEVARADFLYVANLGTARATPQIDVYSVSPNHMLTLRLSMPFPVRQLLVTGKMLYATSGTGKLGEFAIDTTFFECNFPDTASPPDE